MSRGQCGEVLSARTALSIMTAGTSHRQMTVLVFRPGRIIRAIKAERLMARRPCRFGGGFASLFALGALREQVTMVPV